MFYKLSQSLVDNEPKR